MFFIVRVVLHRTDGSDDYTDLHAEMRKRGFSRTIDSDDGKTYRLPPAEYFIESPATTDRIKELAEEAVDAVMADEETYIQRANKQPTILVTSSAHITWSGLQRVIKRS
jgi:hypothetical protein